MSRGRGVRGTALRGTCPECGRSTACYADRYALEAGMGLMYCLMPHNSAPGVKCKGWRIGKADLEPSHAARRADEERAADEAQADYERDRSRRRAEVSRDVAPAVEVPDPERQRIAEAHAREGI